MMNPMRRLQEILAPSVVRERDELREMISGQIVLHHFPKRLSGNSAVTPAATQEPDDLELVERLIHSYANASRIRLEHQGSFWSEYVANWNQDTHTILIEGDVRKVANLLRNPASSMLFHGFDNLTSANASRTQEPAWIHWLHLMTYDSLLRLAEILGVARMQYPEAPGNALGPAEAQDVETLLAGVDEELGFRVDFPNLFPSEIGLATSRGVASYRAVQALYQAYRVKTLIGNAPKARILEIGAGLGWTAYYLTRLGVSAYTIVDLPLVNVAQGYFLGRSLGDKYVHLFGEVDSGTGFRPQIKIAPPHWFFSDTAEYDLAVNVDSMTEMSEDIARKYFQEIGRRAPCLLSINHEYNSFTVRGICLSQQVGRITRTPYSMRRGYVEEIIAFA